MEEADAKKKGLNMEMFKVKVWQKKHEKLQKINEDLKKSIIKKEQFIKIFVNEICKLKFIKKNIDSKLKNIEQFYNTIISERDILGTQLIKVASPEKRRDRAGLREDPDPDAHAREGREGVQHQGDRNQVPQELHPR